MVIAAQRKDAEPWPPFQKTLLSHGLALSRATTTTLQVNVGLVCNQECKHCHLEAGPSRRESMSDETMQQVVAFATRHSFGLIDITGGAPEMHPGLARFLEALSGLAPRVLLRSNLTAMAIDKRAGLLDLLVEKKIGLVVSFPSVNETQADSQRGRGVFQRSIAMLRHLNEKGYGCPGTSLELNLVSNPAGAFLPPAEKEAEKRCKRILQEKYGIIFNRLFNFANMPVGRFKRWLVASGNYQGYMEKLVAGFNPASLDGLMCRTLLSVAWDGFLYDCDFNQAMNIPLAGTRTHITDLHALPDSGTAIAVDDHCYTCTAGSGFT